jgi:hypothetical protein
MRATLIYSFVISTFVSGCYAGCNEKFNEVGIMKSEDEAWNANLHKYCLSRNHWNTELFDKAESHFNTIKRDTHICYLGLCEYLWDDLRYIVHHEQQLDRPDNFENSLYSTINTCLETFKRCTQCVFSRVHTGRCDFQNCT